MCFEDNIKKIREETNKYTTYVFTSFQLYNTYMLKMKSHCFCSCDPPGY